MGMRAPAWAAAGAMLAGAVLGAPAPAGAARPGGTLVLAYDYGLWGVGLPGTRVRTFPAALLAHEAGPAVSPAGDELAFARFDVDDTAPRVLVRALPAGPVREIAAGSAPTFSPDGGELAFQTAAGLQAADLATGAVRAITRDASDRDPAWSRRGVLAFARGPHGRRGVSTVTADGEGLERTVWSSRADVGVLRPAWSPDGRRLAVTVTDVQGRRRASGWCAAAIGSLHVGRRAKLALAVCSGYTAWAPDGSALAVQEDDTLRLVSPQGRPLDRFCDVGIHARGLAWTATKPVSGAGRAAFHLKRHCPPPPPESGQPPTEREPSASRLR